MYVFFVVLVQFWDYYVKDGFKKFKNVSDFKFFSIWDGIRFFKVVEEFERQFFVIGYGFLGKCIDIYFYIFGNEGE